MGLFDRFKKNDSNENKVESKEKVVKNKVESNGSDFTYLDNLIQSNGNEIVLDKDIKLTDNEESNCIDGIIINVDNIVIDGNGHTIDAGDKARIFKIISKDITLKNITFLNGKCKDGGAIYIDKNGSLDIYSSVFENNNSSKGGAINNWGKLKIIDSNFNQNYAREGRAKLDDIITSENKDRLGSIGGAICNFGNLQITNSNFLKNRSDFAGAIINFNNIDIINSKFEGNTGDKGGGAIINVDVLSIKDSKFIKNIGTDIYNNPSKGGAIINCSEALVDSSYFEDNEYGKNNRGFGSAILNYVGTLKILNSEIKDKNADYCTDIVSKYPTYTDYSFIKIDEHSTYETSDGNVKPFNDGVPCGYEFI